MKHYFSYDANGKLLSTETMYGGFQQHHDFLDENCNDPVVVSLRTSRTAMGGIGFVEYDCDCESSVGTCECAGNKYLDSYVSNGSLVPRFDYNIVLDGTTTVQDEATVNYAPGTTISVQLTNSAAPDGTTIAISRRGNANLMLNDLNLTFVSGQTTSFNITAPAQGLSGWLILYGDKAQCKKFAVQGFQV